MDIRQAMDIYDAMTKPVTREDIERYIEKIQAEKLLESEIVEFIYSFHRDSQMGKRLEDMKKKLGWSDHEILVTAVFFGFIKMNELTETEEGK